MRPPIPKPAGQTLRWYTSPRTLLRTILMLDDTPHSIALGTAMGVFIGLTPTVGIQMALVVLVSLITRPFFRFNRIASLITVYISNPITMVPIYWFNYKVGTLFVANNATREMFVRMLEFNNFRQSWHSMLSLFAEVGAPLIVGSLIVAGVTSVVTYPVMRRLLASLQTEKRPTDRVAESPVRCSAD